MSQLLLAGDAAALSQRMQQAAREVGLTDIWFFTQKGCYTQKIQQAMGLELLDREIAEARRQTPASERHAQLEGARKKLNESKKEEKDQLKLPLSEQKYKSALAKLKKELEDKFKI